MINEIQSINGRTDRQTDSEALTRFRFRLRSMELIKKTQSKSILIYIVVYSNRRYFKRDLF